MKITNVLLKDWRIWVPKPPKWLDFRLKKPYSKGIGLFPMGHNGSPCFQDHLFGPADRSARAEAVDATQLPSSQDWALGPGRWSTQKILCSWAVGIRDIALIHPPVNIANISHVEMNFPFKPPFSVLGFQLPCLIIRVYPKFQFSYQLNC